MPHPFITQERKWHFYNLFCQAYCVHMKIFAILFQALFYNSIQEMFCIFCLHMKFSTFYLIFRCEPNCQSFFWHIQWRKCYFAQFCCGCYLHPFCLDFLGECFFIDEDCFCEEREWILHVFHFISDFLFCCFCLFYNCGGFESGCNHRGCGHTVQQCCGLWCNWWCVGKGTVVFQTLDIPSELIFTCFLNIKN